jgi:hypothetical protein
MYVQIIPPSPEIWRLFWFLPGKAEKKMLVHILGEKEGKINNLAQKSKKGWKLI